MNALRWTLAVAALGLLVAPADAALCVKRSGVIVARVACKQKEAPLSAEVFAGTPGVAGAPGAKGDKGDSAGFRVIDSTGREIGIADPYSSVPFLVPSVGILSFVVGPEGFEAYSGKPYLYHEAADCAGLTFVARSISEGFVQYPDVFDGTAYFAGNPVTERTYNSYETPDDTCASGAITARGFCCTNGGPLSANLGPMQTLAVSTLGMPPFTLEK
jgi:hypothetical protein